MQIICIARVHPLRYPSARKFLAIFIVDKPKKQYWRKNATVMPPCSKWIRPFISKKAKNS